MTAAPFGLWPSPITPRMVSQALRFGDCAWDSDGQTLIWHEGRGDRGVLVASRLDGDAPRDLNDELSVRARVGYGGGDFCAGSGRVVYASSGKLYTQLLSGGKARAITPAVGQCAAPALSPDGRWVLYVHSCDRTDCLAIAESDGQLWPQRATGGHDFYMQPRWSPDGKRVAWVAWDHPHMPWISSRVYVADVRPIAGGVPALKNIRALSDEGEVAVFQPEFSPDGSQLSWLGDESESELPLWEGAGSGNREGWHNLHVHDFSSGVTRRITEEKSAQLGAPAWAQGQRTYGWSHDGKSILCIRNERGFSSLWAFSLAGKKPALVAGLGDYSDLLQPALHPKKPLVALIASGGKQPPRVLVHELKGTSSTVLLRRSSSESLPPDDLSAPQAVTWKGAGGESVHALLYLPKADVSKQKNAPDSKARPPAVVRVHGGPTSQARATYSGEAQYYATRGYAYMDLNYRGSTGYGRAYMNALRGTWGIVDVEDAVSAARFLADSGFADADKLVILGGSAGGFTVLQTLVEQPGVFKAGVCLYGVANQFTLVSDTHKFEEKYSDWLLGALPDAAHIYRARSPVFHAAKIVDPVLIFQGDQDEVVPKNQSDEIVAQLRRKGTPHEYHVFEGEGHGWRKTETIEKYYALTEKFLKTHVLFA